MQIPYIQTYLQTNICNINIKCACHVPLESFNLEHFYNFSSSFRTLKQSKNAANPPDFHKKHRIWLCFGVWCFLMIRVKLCILASLSPD